MTTETAEAPPAQEQHAPFVPGSILRALGALVDADAVHDACRVVHVARRVGDGPNPETGELVPYSVIEAIEGRVFVRATYRSCAVDGGVLVDARTAARFTAEEFVEIDDLEIVAPFRLELLGDEAGDGRDAYPDLDPLVPKSDQRLLFSIDPKELARALKTMSACGVKSVEVLQPEYRGGPLGLRGDAGTTTVEACIMPRQPFAVRPQAADDVGGQSMFDFRDVGDELAERERASASGRLTISNGESSVTLTPEDGPRLRKLAKKLRGGQGAK